MRAIVVDRSAPGILKIGEVPDPTPGPDDVVVRVKAFSLNRGETGSALQRDAGGHIPGWDFAGVVERTAHGGPHVGARVVGLKPSGAWAEIATAPAAFLAELPETVSFAEAATLPVAGLTALHSLRKNGDIKDKTVLIAAASGGVGTYALQLANSMGARVVAAIRNPAHEALVRRLGAHEVAIGADLEGAEAFGPYPLILESVGGQSLANAMAMPAPGGMVVVYGASDTALTTFDAARFRVGGASLYGLSLGYELARFEPPGVGLTHLAREVAIGALKPEIAVEAPWEDTAKIAADLMARRFIGKAVLHI